MKNTKKIFFIFVNLLFLAGCATIYNPATEKKEIIFVTTPIEVMLGNNVAMKLSTEYTFIKDPQKTTKVTEIGEKIAKVSDRNDLKYHFAIIKDKEVNAFTTPGGYVYLNSGLLEMVNDDELACVIGHEIGHIAARHIAKKLQAQLGYDILMNIAFSRTGVRDFQKAVSITYDLISLGYSREDELLADRLGAKYAYKAGYDPYSMITFLKKLKDLDKGNMGPVFLRSHPYASQRIEMMQNQIPAIIAKVDNINKKELSKNTEVKKEKPLIPAQTSSKSAGHIKVMCPKCRRIFPANTINYCPYDGIKLN